MSSIECPECGHQALSVATRCPRCGHAFPARPLIRHAASRRDWPSALLAGVIVVGAVLVVATLRWPGRTPAADGSADGSAAAPATTSPPARAQVAPAPTVSRAPSPPSLPVSPTGGLTRYARTWVNVRDGRAQATPSVRVLTPGEPVLVDSLRGGWYRVLAEGRTVGYVHRSNLDAAPPTARP
jgi:hypothetical protein